MSINCNNGPNESGCEKCLGHLSGEGPLNEKKRNMRNKLKKPTTEEIIAGYREAYRICHGMSARIMKMHDEGAFAEKKPVSVVDIAGMTDTELILKLDAVARKNNIHDDLEDDTVLWQQLLLEVKSRLAKK